MCIVSQEFVILTNNSLIYKWKNAWNISIIDLNFLLSHKLKLKKKHKISRTNTNFETEK